MTKIETFLWNVVGIFGLLVLSAVEEFEARRRKKK